MSLKYYKVNNISQIKVNETYMYADHKKGIKHFLYIDGIDNVDKDVFLITQFSDTNKFRLKSRFRKCKLEELIERGIIFSQVKLVNATGLAKIIYPDAKEVDGYLEVV
jgi:hypothetical protein